ncbi:DUF1501 domain-containing protein [Zavarzinella formosa]|uniref:DUF1501 domain-containing protein n=1 Tax=Zavarzinella formosa TaxID=360055 RepID=UPI000363EAC3|nr:DUF1501 domain-containing protein [Zavarzinella formosa]
MPFFPRLDSVNRRQLIQAGFMGLAGVSLPEILRLRSLAAEGGESPPDTAIIYVVLGGGASQFETYDPKPSAPAEIRGEFGAINTNVPGVQFCELMARQAKVMDKLTILRSIYHPSTQHSSSLHLMQTGYYCNAAASENEMPSIGSHVAKLRGPVAKGLPPYVALPFVPNYINAHALGNGFNPFTVLDDPRTKNMSDGERVRASLPFRIPNLTLAEGLTSDQLRDRRTILSNFDNARRIHDLRHDAEAHDEFTTKAFELVTGPAAKRAFDLDQETVGVRDRYGRNSLGQSMLLARRLVENGVTFVTLGTFGWDMHATLGKQMRELSPSYDQAITALVEDLHDRGLNKRVLVVAMGEFGRAPVYAPMQGSKEGPGRDHWGDVSSVLLAGGGLPGGQVIGASDSKGGSPTRNPYRLERILATAYRHLGIDPAQTYPDHNGRPRNLLEIREPIPELS